VTGALLAAAGALAISATAAVPAAAAASGSETLSGTLVTWGVSGTRTVLSSVVVAKGMFTGVGRIVEVPSLPADPPGSSRDDLVFLEGTTHLLSTTVDASFSLNPRNCLFRLTLQQIGKSLAAPASSPTRPAAPPARSAARGCCRATPTAAALPRKRRCTR